MIVVNPDDNLVEEITSKLKENGGGISTNENLSGVDLYDKNAGLIG